MRWARCPDTGKRGYFTEHDAGKALHSASKAARTLRQARTKGIYRAEQRTYECDSCGLWHLTSMSAKSYGIDVPTRAMGY